MLLLIASCKKEGIGGKSTIEGIVAHHGKPIPYSIVYIKYGAKDFPGIDVTTYSDHTTADANAHYEYHNLRKGFYYLYAVGFDNSISQSVSGGLGVSIKYNKTSETDVPVTE